MVGQLNRGKKKRIKNWIDKRAGQLNHDPTKFEVANKNHIPKLRPHNKRTTQYRVLFWTPPLIKKEADNNLQYYIPKKILNFDRNRQLEAEKFIASIKKKSATQMISHNYDFIYISNKALFTYTDLVIDIK
jgi:hypothetical protein